MLIYFLRLLLHAMLLITRKTTPPELAENPAMPPTCRSSLAAEQNLTQSPFQNKTQDTPRLRGLTEAWGMTNAQGLQNTVLPLTTRQ